MLIRFFVTNFNNPGIVSPDTRDLILQTISVLLQYPEYVRQFEADEYVREHFMHSLIGSFDSRFWIPITSILLRLWQGTGFCHSKTEGNDCSSLVLQKCFHASASKNLDGLNAFLNHIFNNLNWTVTEFHVALKEIEDAAKNRLSADLRDLQRKCNITFELSTHLFRVLELLTLEAPMLFLGSGDVNLSRLVEMVLHMVNHTTVGKDSVLFEAIVQLSLPGLDKLNRASILDPIVGICCNLGRLSVVDAVDVDHRHSLVQKLLSYEHAFILDNMEYVGNFAQCRVNQKETGEEISTEIGVLFDGIRDAAIKRRISDRANVTNNDELKGETCSICYTEELDTQFVPCGHTSCRRCIDRHLLNNTNCFFCNALVVSVKQFSEKLLEESVHAHTHTS